MSPAWNTLHSWQEPRKSWAFQISWYSFSMSKDLFQWEMSGAKIKQLLVIKLLAWKSVQSVCNLLLNYPLWVHRSSLYRKRALLLEAKLRLLVFIRHETIPWKKEYFNFEALHYVVFENIIQCTGKPSMWEPFLLMHNNLLIREEMDLTPQIYLHLTLLDWKDLQNRNLLPIPWII